MQASIALQNFAKYELTFKNYCFLFHGIVCLTFLDFKKLPLKELQDTVQHRATAWCLKTKKVDLVIISFKSTHK